MDTSKAIGVAQEVLGDLGKIVSEDERNKVNYCWPERYYAHSRKRLLPVLVVGLKAPPELPPPPPPPVVVVPDILSLQLESLPSRPSGSSLPLPCNRRRSASGSGPDP